MRVFDVGTRGDLLLGIVEAGAGARTTAWLSANLAKEGQGSMAGVELEAGKRWTEQRFTEIAAELGAVGGVAPGDRWRELGKRFRTEAHCMTYYVELAGHVKRGEIVFRDVDLEDAGADDKVAQTAIERQIRNLLESLRPNR